MAIPPELRDVLMLALANPATLGVGYWLGRRADQPQKIAVAALVAGVAGTAFAWLAMRTGLTEAKPRLLAGALVASVLAGAGWAWLGYSIQNRGRGDE